MRRRIEVYHREAGIKMRRKLQVNGSVVEYNRRTFKKFLLDNLAGMLFTLPLVLGLIIFSAIPIIQSLIYSFYRYDMTTTLEFIGFDNYANLLWGYDSAEVRGVFGRTFLYAIITVPLTLVLSYLVAVLLHQNVKGIKTFRVLCYLPCLIPGVVSALVWRSMLDQDYGIFNAILQAFGLSPIKWLEAKETAMFSMIFMGLWGVSGGMILWLAAFNNIPSTLYEAADIDGAGRVRKFFNITLPLSTSMIFYNLVTGVIGSLQVFSTFIMAGGGDGPEKSLYFIAVKIYKEAFQRWNMGYASALAWVLFVVIAILTSMVFKTSKWVYYGEEG